MKSFLFPVLLNLLLLCITYNEAGEFPAEELAEGLLKTSLQCHIRTPDEEDTILFCGSFEESACISGVDKDSKKAIFKDCISKDEVVSEWCDEEADFHKLSNIECTEPCNTNWCNNEE